MFLYKINHTFMSGFFNIYQSFHNLICPIFLLQKPGPRFYSIAGNIEKPFQLIFWRKRTVTDDISSKEDTNFMNTSNPFSFSKHLLSKKSLRLIKSTLKLLIFSTRVNLRICFTYLYESKWSIGKDFSSNTAKLSREFTEGAAINGLIVH